MPSDQGQQSFGTLRTLETAAGPVRYYRLATLEEDGIGELSRLPFTIRVLLEAALRAENGREVTRDDVLHLATYQPAAPARVEIPFKPARVLVQDFTGVPAVVDLAALRSAVARLGGDPARIDPQVPVDLVIDHSVQVDHFGSPQALQRNAELELQRNRERYELLRWGQQAFANLRVVPPATGICHQVNLEYLATVVARRSGDGGNGETIAFPDSLVGLDSHTTMINGLGVLGWGVGGIEAEAVMLGQPLAMLLPPVVGVRLVGRLPAGATATDLALMITELLRRTGVVGRFVELFGEGLATMSLADRATVANMAPEYGATCSFFPVDDETLRYLAATGRPRGLIDLVERYCKEQGLFRTADTPDPQFHQTVELDLSAVQPSLAGPRRPQDRIALGRIKQRWQQLARAPVADGGYGLSDEAVAAVPLATGDEQEGRIGHGAVVLAAITSCTNTSNPSVLLAAGLLAKKAVAAGLTTGAHVKTSLAPGSKVVTDYLREAGLLPSLEQLGFHVVGYGCTTCIGNSGPLPEAVSRAIADGQLVVAGVLSGNRNFEGRIHQQVRANFLASPPLVVAYALAGRIDIDLTSEPIGTGSDGKPVLLQDIWPTGEEIAAHLDSAADPQRFRRVYDRLLDGDETWAGLAAGSGALFDWNATSTYVQEPPFFHDLAPEPPPIGPIEGARVLVMAGDSVTTDHISPAGAIAADSPAGRYLLEQGVAQYDFNSYGSRRGNDRVMVRGTFANIRLKNRLAGGREGGWTTHLPSGELVTIFEAAQRYRQAGIPTIVVAGADYGMGSSRDWAAKGTFLLGVRAVIARSFERIHRSNLIGMGVLPLQLADGDSAEGLGLSGAERYTIRIGPDLTPGADVAVEVTGEDGSTRSLVVTCRIDTPVELEYYRNGGILHTVLRRLVRGT